MYKAFRIIYRERTSHIIRHSVDILTTAKHNSSVTIPTANTYVNKYRYNAVIRNTCMVARTQAV